MKGHQPKLISLSNVPDNPVSFGYKIAWIAIKTKRTDRIFNALETSGFSNQRSANWETGMEMAYSYDENYNHNELFITPAVDGWTFVVGFALAEFLPADKGKSFLDFFQTLAKSIPDLFYFASYRVSDYYAWISIKNSVIKRSFAVVDGKCFEQGPATPEEIKLEYKPFDGLQDEENEEFGSFPSEEDVIELASMWSIDPTILEEQYKENLGVGIVVTRKK